MAEHNFVFNQTSREGELGDSNICPVNVVVKAEGLVSEVPMALVLSYMLPKVTPSPTPAPPEEGGGEDVTPFSEPTTETEYDESTELVFSLINIPNGVHSFPLSESMFLFGQSLDNRKLRVRVVGGFQEATEVRVGVQTLNL